MTKEEKLERLIEAIRNYFQPGQTYNEFERHEIDIVDASADQLVAMGEGAMNALVWDFERELRRVWKYVEYETDEARETVDALYNWACELLSDLPGVDI